MADPHGLQRFVDAQAPVYAQVTAELVRGRKASHWMWFIFPQIAGLGSSAMAQRYAIAGREEARAYLGHPVLGPRLLECTRLVIAHEGRSAEDIFGGIDALKFRSSMTLFATVADEPGPFEDTLAKFFGGKADPLTLERL